MWNRARDCERLNSIRESQRHEEKVQDILGRRNVLFLSSAFKALGQVVALERLWKCQKPELLKSPLEDDSKSESFQKILPS